MAFVTGSPGYPPDAAETRARIRNDFERSYYPPGFQRQYAAVLASPIAGRSLRLSGLPLS